MSEPTGTWLLDSGAFSALYRGVKITVEQYADFLHEHQPLFVGGAITLDKIGDREGSYRNWRRFKDMGIDTIPVFHADVGSKNDQGYEYLDKYLEEAPYIAIGAVAKSSTRERFFGLDSIWEHIRSAGMEGKVKVHGLGLTSVPIILRYPWYSVDAATVIKAGANGAILIPELSTDGVPIGYENSRLMVVSSQGRHEVGTLRGFYSLPPNGVTHRQIVRYCASLGHVLPDSIEGRVLKARRAHPGESRTSQFSLGIEAPVLEKTDSLVTSYGQREEHNFKFFAAFEDFLRARGQNTIIYHVVGEPGQVRRNIAVSRGEGREPRFLVSFWVFRDRPSFLRYFLNNDWEYHGRK